MNSCLVRFADGYTMVTSRNAIRKNQAEAPMEREPTTDERQGMAWWNAISEDARRYWMQQAGNTGRVADAWEAYKASDLSDQTGSEKSDAMSDEKSEI